MNEIDAIKCDLEQVMPTLSNLNELNETYNEIVDDIKNLPWLQNMTIRGGTNNLHFSLIKMLVQTKRTVALDPITALLIIKLILEIIYYLRRIRRTQGLT